MKKKTIPIRRNEQRLRSCSVLREKWSIEDVFKREASTYNLKPEELKNRSRLSVISECRKRCAYVCCQIIGYPVEEVAAYLRISGSAVSWAVRRGKELTSKKDVDKFISFPPG